MRNLISVFNTVKNPWGTGSMPGGATIKHGFGSQQARLPLVFARIPYTPPRSPVGSRAFKFSG